MQEITSVNIPTAINASPVFVILPFAKGKGRTMSKKPVWHDYTSINMVGGNVINQEVENECVHGVVMHEEDVGIVRLHWCYSTDDWCLSARWVQWTICIID